MVIDESDEPQYGERIPYVIVRGQPNTRLVDRAVRPEEVLNNSKKHIDAAYYISKVLIPPLERVFNLMGADVRAWYDEMPKALRVDQIDSTVLSPRKGKEREDTAPPTTPDKLKIDEHFITSKCLTCGALCEEGFGVCEACYEDKQTVISALLSKLHIAEERMTNAHAICASCSNISLAEPVECESLDCPWLYERKKADNRAGLLGGIGQFVEDLDSEELEDDDVCESRDDRERSFGTAMEVSDDDDIYQ